MSESSELSGFFRGPASETELAESQRMLATLLAHLPGMAYRCRPDPDWTIEFVSEGSSELTGYSPRQLVGNRHLPFGELIHPGDRVRIAEEIRTALKEQTSFLLSYRIRTAAGDEKWVWEKGSGLLDSEGKLIAIEGFITNVSDRHKTEEELRESEEKFRTLAEESPNMIFINARGRVVYANAKCEEVMGYRREELFSPEFDFLRLVAPESHTLVRANLARHMRGEDIPPYEYTIVTKAGERLEAIHTTKLIQYDGDHAILGIVTDVTERKQMERALQESEEQYRRLVDNSMVGIYKTKLNGDILYVNDALLDILEFEAPEEMYAVDVSSFYRNNGDREEFLRQLRENSKVAGFETELVGKSGRTKTVLLNGTLEDDVISGMIMDISERKRAEEDKAELERQLLQSQKMEAIGRLAGGVAHDFNNLLTAINGYSEFLAQEIPEDSPLRADVEQIRRAGTRAASLTRQLLAFSRRQVLQAKPLDLNELVRNLHQMVGRIIGEDIQVIHRLEQELWTVKADPGQIDQVLLNLAINARDAMPGGGTLEIRTANKRVDGSLGAVSDEVPPGEYVTLQVSDTGSGMDEATRQHIFEPFFTTKGTGQGTGLGLSTVYGIVKQSGAHISVSSEPGKGASFTVYLPRVYEDGGRQDGPATPGSSRGGSETLLIVEDEPSVRRLAQRILEKIGYRVLTADNGDAALTICRRQGESIDMVVTDVVMPGLSGPQLAEDLARLRPNMKLLYMSGYTEMALIYRALEKGTPFLSKPFTAAELGRKVREVLDAAQ